MWIITSEGIKALSEVYVSGGVRVVSVIDILKARPTLNEAGGLSIRQKGYSVAVVLKVPFPPHSKSGPKYVMVYVPFYSMHYHGAVEHQ